MHRFLTPLLFTGGVSFYILLARMYSLLRQGVGIPSAKTNTENGTLKATGKTQLAHRYAWYLFYVLLYFLTMGIVREQYSKCHSRHFFIYACADSSKWGLFGRCARSAFRRTPSGRETCKTLFLYQRYTKGIQKAGAIKYGCPFAIYFL